LIVPAKITVEKKRSWDMERIGTLTRTAKAQRTQWAAQFLAASELVRRGYVVSFTMGNHTPTADLMVGIPNGGTQFWVDVKGLSSNNAWLITPKPQHENLFYILVRVGIRSGENRKNDRFFILSQKEMNQLLDEARAEREARNSTDKTEGFGFRHPRDYEDRWGSLPQRGLLNSD
jgi:hypothetical protein